jgi:hypothetical protein
VSESFHNGAYAARPSYEKIQAGFQSDRRTVSLSPIAWLIGKIKSDEAPHSPTQSIIESARVGIG